MTRAITAMASKVRIPIVHAETWAGALAAGSGGLIAAS